jgi:hypothetical protein
MTAKERNRIYSRTPRPVSKQDRSRSNLERLLVLAGMGKQNPLWNVVLSYTDEHARNEFEFAMRPGLTDAERQYNAGRAASADDFAMALRDLALNAEKEATKLKAE